MEERPQIVVLAKRPRPGHVKTRLTPPYSPEEAAALAAAALRDTLDAVAATPAAARLLALDEPGREAPGGGQVSVPDGLEVPDGFEASVPDGFEASVPDGFEVSVPDGFEVIGQRGGGLDERLAWAFADAHARRPLPVLLIGMDTPQVTPALLSDAAAALAGHDAVFGPASDGGFWLLGLRRPDARRLLGVPMSTSGTGAAQLGRLRGLSVAFVPELTDVDDAASAREVAARAPHTRFAAALARADQAASLARADRGVAVGCVDRGVALAGGGAGAGR
ncbi:DUF2064 domain-containing protein [Actinomadura sp. ATCC 31491]|uniref:DUF2064 domain-containing protein n=1 Tax=Actinomadura luzonensis TaxID=2805427 RepID=A0ABT0G818_9ACTN|nr:DUF2064 domain-containing protein [Actinomadura luzonensis]MCK2220736.1 DUF2064 domain-containing protein [Actinomadura luzonensis]